MVQDLIRYDLLVQDALRGVVKKVLADAARDGMPGEHHFYISFLTGAPGVRLSQRLREKHPDEMTIVLQHQFWDLGITEHAFEVGLAFGGIPERLLIPFDAITGFFDPSVQFALKFEIAGAETAEPPPQKATKPAKQPKQVEKAETSSAKLVAPVAPMLLSRGEERSPSDASGSDGERPAPRKPAAAAEPASDRTKTTDKAKPSQPEAEPVTQGAQVVSLDAFRKKS